MTDTEWLTFVRRVGEQCQSQAMMRALLLIADRGPQPRCGRVYGTPGVPGIDGPTYDALTAEGLACTRPNDGALCLTQAGRDAVMTRPGPAPGHVARYVHQDAVHEGVSLS